MTDNVKEIRWGRVIGGRVVEVLDEADDGHPAAWFHEDTLHEWQIIPNDQFVGSHFEDGQWYTGAEFFDLEMARNPKAEDIARPREQNMGEVLDIDCVNRGSRYSHDFDFKDQIDFPSATGASATHMVVEVTFNEDGEADTWRVLAPGQGYKVGMGFKINRGFGFDWDRKNPDYAEFVITKVVEDGVPPPHIEANSEGHPFAETIMTNVGVILVNPEGNLPS